jgi:hypothetical protein
VLVMLVVIAFINASIVRLMLGRHIASTKVESSTRMRRAAQSASHQTAACLQESDFGRADCSLPAGGCLPSTVDGYSVNITAGGSPPECRLTVSVSR